ncbi:MAG: hypothetical protein JST05_01250 [Acidobacteria bacterium]|nr:hypothetical protein [Acidobacteriota bacterium]
MQTYANHRRIDTGYHIWLAIMLAVNLVASVVHLVRHHHGAGEIACGLWLLMMAAAFMLMAWKIREYPLMAQNRIIRLEERMRMQALLPGDLKARIGELSETQIVALRFAADGELGDRVREALDQNLRGEQIKKRIQVWRPDTYRV